MEKSGESLLFGMEQTMAGVTAMPAKSDAQFQIEQDARALIEAEQIKLDTKRVKAARGQIQKDLKATKAAMS